MHKIFRNSGGKAIPLELSIIKNKIDTAAVVRMENLPTEEQHTRWNIVIYISQYIPGIYGFLDAGAIFPKNKKIYVQSEFANMKLCICITYCVKQRNRITIINENIVSWSRFAKIRSDGSLHALLIRPSVLMGELRLFIFRHSSRRKKCYINKKKSEN